MPTRASDVARPHKCRGFTGVGVELMEIVFLAHLARLIGPPERCRETSGRSFHVGELAEHVCQQVLTRLLGEVPRDVVAGAGRCNVTEYERVPTPLPRDPGAAQRGERSIDVAHTIVVREARQ